MWAAITSTSLKLYKHIQNNYIIITNCFFYDYKFIIFLWYEVNKLLLMIRNVIIRYLLIKFFKTPKRLLLTKELIIFPNKENHTKTLALMPIYH